MQSTCKTLKGRPSQSINQAVVIDSHVKSIGKTDSQRWSRSCDIIGSGRAISPCLIKRLSAAPWGFLMQEGEKSEIPLCETLITAVEGLRRAIWALGQNPVQLWADLADFGGNKGDR